MGHSLRRETQEPARLVRRLFLDDDPQRAALFLEHYPDAVWVTTVVECIEQLQTAWDEIYLDHDLGGEQYVDVARDDCGMAVVRWLSSEPRPHLKSARFFVHSHNGVAAYVMVLQMKALGLTALASPFVLGHWKPKPPPPPSFWKRMLSRLPWRNGPRSIPPGSDEPSQN